MAAEPAAAERRHISVLFVDLVDFTTLAETLDPEEVRAVQSRYFEVARSSVATYGGTIEKFIGDAVMAVWGAPAAHEDDADRAVRAALAIVDAVSRLGGAASRRVLAARAAVATGEAVVTVGATDQGMVAGDLVNVAARLQGHAPSGGVLVDDSTRALAIDAAEYQAFGSLSLQGRSAQLVSFLATARVDSRPERRRGSHTGPFIGRERELRELIELFDGAVRDGRSRLVSVTGIAGIGKSRLAWELAEHLERQPLTVAWHSGRAPAYGDEITFAAVAEMIRRRTRISDDAHPGLARRQLATMLTELVRDEEERSWLEPRVAVLLERDGLAAFDRDELFAAWRRFFERVSDSGPTVLVFEDLQWADPSLLDFIEHLAIWARRHPILIVALARPELLDRRPTWGAGIGSFTALHLERLSDADMRTLLLGRAPGMTQTDLDRVLQHAGGVPLYAVEVARVLSDAEENSHADVTERRSAPRVALDRRAPAVDVPDSLHGLIATRIDALPPAERRLLLAAGVLGRRFRPEALAAVTTAEAGDVRERIETLVRRELLTIDDELASPGHGELGFVQDLVREVAYQTLSRTERRALHLAAARYLESRPDEDLAESLAGHLVEAHRLAPDHPDAHRVARRAVGALRRAAQGALRLHVPERALDHLEQALRLTDTPEQRAVVLEEAAAAARAAARLELAEEHLREAVALHRSAGHRSQTARTRAQLASVMLMAQRNEPALAELDAALRAFRDFGADGSGVELAAQLARARTLVGDNRGGMEWAERALAAAERLGLDGIAGDLLVTRGTARYRLGDEEAGLADLRLAIAEAEDAGSVLTELRARNNLAWLVVADDPRTAMDTAREAVELATTMGVGDLAVQLAEVACAVALDTGDWDWALATAAELEHRVVPQANRINLASALSMIRSLRGDPRPLASIEAMEPLAADMDRQVLAGVDHARAWAAFVAGDFAVARDRAARATGGSYGAERIQQWTLATRASLWMADPGGAAEGLRELEALGIKGRAGEAAAETLAAGLSALTAAADAAQRYRRAEESWRQLDLPLHLALCIIEAHRLLPDASAPGEALAILESLGAHGLISMAFDGTSRTVVTAPGAPPPPARSRRPTARTASRSDAGHRRRRATDPPAPPG